MYNNFMETLRSLLLGSDPVLALRVLDENGDLEGFDPLLAGLRMPVIPGVHHKDNLEHSIRVLENAINLEGTVDVVLRSAALLHDIGKPKTRRVGSHKSVTFNGHEVVGARLAGKMLKKHGYSNSEISDVCELIAMHMRSHGFGENGGWTDSAVRRLLNDVSSETQLDRLIKIFYADVTSKHKSKRERVYRQVDGLVAALDRVRAEDARRKMRPILNGYDVMELLNIEPGPKLGAVMKFLNSDENILLTREEAIQKVRTVFSGS